ncbi:hypothetical protein HZS_5573 [Henneguya salminicola]|nr:hypothetical protein HZS_5573 [Henneguya salminicola]
MKTGATWIIYTNDCITWDKCDYILAAKLSNRLIILLELSMAFSHQVKVRYISCFVLWLTLFTFYTMRSNMSVAMLAMTKQSSDLNSTSFSSCINLERMKKSPDHHVYEFTWTQAEQGINFFRRLGYILSAFFVGYFSTHLLGSILSFSIGPRTVMIICLVGSTIFTFLMAVLPYIGTTYFIIGRAIIGLFSGPLYPSLHLLIASYAPVRERTILTVITHTGNILGLSFNFGVGGYIVEHIPQGWKYLFIMNGVLGIFTLILWCIFIYSSPSEHPYMSQQEKTYICGAENSTSYSHKMALKEIPFTSILLCPHVGIICLATFGGNLILYAQLTGHPKYLSSVFGISKSMASYLSIIPFMCNFTFQIIYPFLFDYNRLSKWISKTTFRRLSAGIGFIGASIFLAPVGFVPCNQMAISISMVTMSMVFLGANQSGSFTAIIDISPRFSGIIMGLASTFGSLSGVLQPQLASFLIKNGDRKEGYLLVFAITSLVSLLMGLPFILFGSAVEKEFTKKCVNHDEYEKITLITNHKV